LLKVDTWLSVLSTVCYKTQPLSGLGEELLATHGRRIQETHKG